MHYRNDNRSAMRILILDTDHANAVAQAVRLSSSGLIVETVANLSELEFRLASVKFDAVLLNDSSLGQKAIRLELEKYYPLTKFFSIHAIADFIEFLGDNETRTAKPDSGIA
jgi:hypothetical protein